MILQQATHKVLDWFSEKNNERFWFLIAFLFFLLIVYGALSYRPSNTRCDNDPTANCPTESDMRAGQTY